ncbi:hypothetical protein [Chryseobacterium oryzae]|uniref:DUF1003 domain-containing protein n=1 Tax=Chryseobacterium oryzae TaxID=2929799 RepID=A0ABY4BH20_9FLAO|nr:hypothetical protein [Chryseobacterium oryzae]UOE37021.1 hypothetical protein MTP08_08045 [Chryseobacterium oryzae]
MELNEIIQNDYVDKIILTLIPIILKGIFGNKTETKKYLNIFINYLLPTITIIWINLDESISLNKLTTTLIVFNFAFILLSFLNQTLIKHYKMISTFTEAETDKVKQINHVNEVQIEKVKAINDNQKYILGELSKINDRIIKYFTEK